VPQTLSITRPATQTHRPAIHVVDGGADQSATTHPLSRLEADIRELRERVFDLADTAREVAPYEMTQLHVSLQIVSNELGLVERVLGGAHD
jgi:hypothetical protein